MLPNDEAGELLFEESITGQGLTTLTRACDTNKVPFENCKPLKHFTSKFEARISGAAGFILVHILLVQIDPFPLKTSTSNCDLNKWRLVTA
jgi:hypothetical protein